MLAGIGNGTSACSTSPIKESSVMMVNCLNSFKVNNSVQYYTFQVVSFYHNIGKISMLVTNCQPDFADKTRLVVKTTNLRAQTRMVTGVLSHYLLSF